MTRFVSGEGTRERQLQVFGKVESGYRGMGKVWEYKVSETTVCAIRRRSREGKAR